MRGPNHGLFRDTACKVLDNTSSPSCQTSPLTRVYSGLDDWKGGFFYLVLFRRGRNEREEDAVLARARETNEDRPCRIGGGCVRFCTENVSKLIFFPWYER